VPAININFIGPWKVILGVKTVTVNITSIDEARDYVETQFASVLEKKLESMGVNKKQPIWDNSNVLLNGKNIKTLNSVALKDGDKLDMIPKVAGG
jgi:molybdopterin converting factor small subunit